MSESCSICQGVLAKPFVCENCNLKFHSRCAKFKFVRIDKSDKKCCINCQSSKPRRGSIKSVNLQDTVDVPVYSSLPDLTLSAVMDQNHVNPPATSTDSNKVDSVLELLTSMNTDLKTMKNEIIELKEMKTTIGLVEAKLNPLIAQITTNNQLIINLDNDLQLANSKISSNEAEIIELKKAFSFQSNTNLSAPVPQRPTWERDIVITGLTDLAVENAFEFLKKLSQVLLIDFCDHLVDDVIVLPVVRGKPRVLIVKFITKIYRNKWLQAKKNKRDLLLSEIIQTNENLRIYINERSTALERKCYQTARLFARQKGYLSPWMRTGQVYLKRNAESSPDKFPQDFPEVNADLLTFPQVTGNDLTGAATHNVIQDTTNSNPFSQQDVLMDTQDTLVQGTSSHNTQPNETRSVSTQ